MRQYTIIYNMAHIEMRRVLTATNDALTLSPVVTQHKYDQFDSRTAFDPKWSRFFLTHLLENSSLPSGKPSVIEVLNASWKYRTHKLNLWTRVEHSLQSCLQSISSVYLAKQLLSLCPTSPIWPVAHLCNPSLES